MVEQDEKVNLTEWVEKNVNNLMLSADSNDIGYAIRNLFTIKQFIDIFHIEDISYLKYYGSKTLVYLDTDVYGVDGNYLDLMKALNTQVLKTNKHIQFCKIPSKCKIVVNSKKVLDVNNNAIELRQSSFPIRGVLTDNEVESFKTCILVLKNGV